MPSAVDEIWNEGRYRGQPWDEIEERDDVGYLLAVIDDASARLPIDASRVYVGGMSNGATMAARLACEHAERFAAVPQVSGTAAVDFAAGCRPAVHVPILQIHGTRDRYAPDAGGRARGLRARLLLHHPDRWRRAHVAGQPVVGAAVLRSDEPRLRRDDGHLGVLRGARTRRMIGNVVAPGLQSASVARGRRPGHRERSIRSRPV